MLPKPLRAIWGDLSAQEVKKFGILSSIFFMVIGIYWMLKTMKDPIFDLHVGFRYQPWAKIASLVFVALVVIFYSKLVDWFKKQTVFYIVCGFYGLGFIALSYMLSNPQFISQWSLIPGNILGWASYLFIESFGSIMPALFWAFVASNTTADSAKRGYAMIATCTQVGTIFGPLLISTYSARFGLPLFFGVSGLLIFVIPFIITYYTKVVPDEQTQETNAQQKKGKSGFIEGLRLLMTKPYLMGVFAIATLYEFIGTILDFQKGMLISANYPSRIDGGAAFAWFKGLEGSSIGVISLLFAMFGTSFFMRRFGLKFSLISFPTVIGLTVITVFAMYLMGANSYQLMWVFFGAVVLIKGLNYALNNPSKEVLYIPTSKDVKFKTKGWIDAFGARLLKTFGAGVNNSLSSSLPTLLTLGTFLSLGVVGVWIFAASYVSGAFDTLQKENKIVE
jgi:AAA family ATP:ADP antiporter